MIDFRNPYTPGAGVMPRYLAGRSDLVDSARQRLQAVSEGYQARSVIYYGLRGVGKTVLLNAVEEEADKLEVLCRHIEVKEDGDLTKTLASAANAFVVSLSAFQAAKNWLSRLASVAKSFSATWNPADNTLSLGLNDAALIAATAGTGDLSNDLTQLLVELGKCARQCRKTICFCIDDVQYARKEELGAVMTALHRASQLNLPIIFFCAGLPRILKDVGDVKSYSERLFEFIEVDSLNTKASAEAIVEPAKPFGVEYDEDAVVLIIQETAGYPYFIQEMCATIWERSDGRRVTADDVAANIDETNRRLDKGFFLVRYNRCTTREQEFLQAMASCGELPCTIANVAKAMGRKVTAISPFRAKLINKGLIYATGRGEIDFTVPRFDAFLKRVQGI
ncbi:ATP-binding protein [Enorma phocaeensis]|uniref:ATP-binding protein n=1 Tax=Enorma phocaeensis TaxID=1871019 RepID=A0A921ITQ2_9ACTN|nr:ATP-binding protein [Enorma phocaeensis]HJG37632.1 ATP-binding protein [Enorma phocaeensis]